MYWELFNQMKHFIKDFQKAWTTYSDFEVLKDRILIQTNKINYENHLFRKFHVLYFFMNILSSHIYCLYICS